MTYVQIFAFFNLLGIVICPSMRSKKFNPQTNNFSLVDKEIHSFYMKEHLHMAKKFILIQEKSISVTFHTHIQWRAIQTALLAVYEVN